MTGAVPAASLVGIHKAFGTVSVLGGVDLDFHRGEVHAVLGQNGAGKSTLMRILLGIERADSGTMRLGELPYAPRGPADARKAGVVMVPQERTLCPHLGVAENIMLGIEPRRAAGLLRAAKGRDIAARALSLLGGEAGKRIPLDVPAGSLSVADQQVVEIARALAQGGAFAETATMKVLVLDEPTASLGKADAQRLFERVQALKETGLAIVLVTHFLGDVRDHADRYTVLRDGKVAGAGNPSQVPAERIVHEMLGRELGMARQEPKPRDAVAPSEATGTVLLEVRAVGGAVLPREATLTLHRGEILGIAGLVGSGRTELLRTIAGLDRVCTGSVVTHATAGIGLLSEDRGGEGLMLNRSISDNIALSRRGSFFFCPRALLASARTWIAELAVKASGPEQRVGDLSGGNQQKVQIARLLREDYDVLLVDEPTRGIDVASKAQVLALLRDLARRGKGVILVSSQLDELVSTCDRIAVLCRGKLGAPLPALQWNEQSLLLEASS